MEKSNLDNICDDVIKQITKYLNFEDQMILFSVNNKLNINKHNYFDGSCIFRNNIYYIFNPIDTDKWWFVKLKNIHFKNSFTNILPSQNVEKIYFDTTEDYGFDLSNFILSPKITDIIFGNNFDRNITIKLPDTLISITFEGNFDKSLQNVLPKSIKKIIFGLQFNQNIHNTFFEGIEYIKFGNNFNQSVENNIPNSVKYLQFGDNFNQELTSLPKNLEILGLGEKFDNIIDLTSVKNLKELTIKTFNNFSLEEIMTSINKLTIYMYSDMCNNIDELIKYLSLGNKKLIIYNDMDISVPYETYKRIAINKDALFMTEKEYRKKMKKICACGYNKKNYGEMCYTCCYRKCSNIISDALNNNVRVYQDYNNTIMIT